MADARVPRRYHHCTLDDFVTYDAQLSVQCLDAAGLLFHVRLPQEFVIRPGSSQTSTNGARWFQPTSVLNARAARFNVQFEF